MKSNQMKQLLLLVFFTLGFGIALGQSEKPNIVLIIADDHGADALGCYGNEVIQTPALDRLATEGIRFTNAFCTTASCSASRSVILTGKFNHATGHYGHEHAFHHFSTFDGEKSLPVYLEKAGYRTGRVGKYHLAPESVYHFQEVFQAEGRNPVEMAENCSDFISGSGDTPFFLYYCTNDPHRSGETVDVPYKPNAFGNRPQGYPGVVKKEYNPADTEVPDFLPDNPECHAELAQYYQSVSRVDQGVAKLVEILKESGEYESTLIIYISDNGIAFPGAKTTLNDPGMRLPCIIRQPGGINAGKVTDHLVSWVDLTPTILDYTDVFPAENTFQGKSFIHTLSDPMGEGPDTVFASHTFHEITMYYPMRVIRTSRYKFIYNIAYPLDYPSASDLWASPTWQAVYRQGEHSLYGKRSIHDYIHRTQFELYDILKDPDETENLAYLEEYAELVEDLKTTLKVFMERTNDPWAVKWKYE